MRRVPFFMLPGQPMPRLLSKQTVFVCHYDTASAVGDGYNSNDDPGDDSLLQIGALVYKDVSLGQN